MAGATGGPNFPDYVDPADDPAQQKPYNPCDFSDWGIGTEYHDLEPSTWTPCAELKAKICPEKKPADMCLFEAAKGGQHLRVAYLCKSEPGTLNDTSADYGGCTVLLVGVRAGEAAVVKALVAAEGANLACVDPKTQDTPITLACILGRADLVRILLDAGADVEARRGKGGRTPLMIACVEGNEALAEMLIKGGASLDAARDGERAGTPLFEAALHGHVDLVRDLVKRGAPLGENVDTRRFLRHVVKALEGDADKYTRSPPPAEQAASAEIGTEDLLESATSS